MDIIFLRELKVDTLIGVYEWEKRVPQTLQIDLEIALPHSRACETDDIRDALDYAGVTKAINGGMAHHGRRLAYFHRAPEVIGLLTAFARTLPTA